MCIRDRAIVDDAKAVIDKTLTATADVEEKPSVMVLEPLGEDITNYGAKSLGGDMVTQLGATLANPDASTEMCIRDRSRAFHHKLEQAGMTQSMSRVAHCTDNGPMEGFWGCLLYTSRCV